jgi:hypothetical protein
MIAIVILFCNSNTKYSCVACIVIISCRFITQEGFKLEKTKPTVPPAITGVVSWRAEGIKYRKNEVFLDVVESINLLVCSLPPYLPSITPHFPLFTPSFLHPFYIYLPHFTFTHFSHPFHVPLSTNPVHSQCQYLNQ